jgi:hypothetical protein
MKTLFRTIIFTVLFVLLQINAYAETHILNQSFGSITFMEEEYVNNMDEVFIINIGIYKPVEFELHYDIEDYCDFIYIYEIDNAGNEQLIGSYTGVGSLEFVSTTIPSGKAKFVFHTNGNICGENGSLSYANGDYYGIECYFSVAAFNECVSECDNAMVNDLWIGNNTNIGGNLGIGTFNPRIDIVHHSATKNY